MHLHTKEAVSDALTQLPFLLLPMVLAEATILQQALGLGEARCWHPPRYGYCEKMSVMLLEAS